LALALAESRRRTLIMDTCGADGLLTRLMGLRPEPKTGLYEQLSAHMSGSMDSWTIYRIADSLSIIPASPVHAPMAPMLSSIAFSDLLEQCRALFDVIILDTRPLSESSDAVILNQRSDALLLVTRRGQTTLKGVASFVDQIDPRHVVGVVFNQH